jgi:hypothetical protein
VLLAATMTVGLLQPLVAVGMDAAVGLLISVMVRGPRYGVMIRAVLALLRIGVAVGAIFLGTQVFQNPEGLSSVEMWFRVLVQGMAGDQGLRLLNLEESGLLWVDLPYGVLVGLVLLILTLVQAWLAGRLVNWAARVAARAE